MCHLDNHGHGKVQVKLYWFEQSVDDLALWPFAVKYATWLYNWMPSKVILIVLLTKTHSNHKDLLRTYVWGCPTFILDLKL